MSASNLLRSRAWAAWGLGHETIRIRTLYNCWVGPRNVVLDDAGFSIQNGVFLAKSPHYFSRACCARAVDNRAVATVLKVMRPCVDNN